MTMEKKLWLEEKIDTLKNDSDFQLEELKLAISEKICEYMIERGLNRSQLAEKLSCSKAYVTKLLDGGENLTIAKLFQISKVLETKLHVHLLPIEYNCQVFYKYNSENSIHIPEFDPRTYSAPFETKNYVDSEDLTEFAKTS